MIELDFDQLPEDIRYRIVFALPEAPKLWALEHNRRVILRRFGYLPPVERRQANDVCGFENQQEYDSYNFQS